MAASIEDWSCDSNRAVRVSLVRPSELIYASANTNATNTIDPLLSSSARSLKSASSPNPTTTLETVHTFHPKFTYPIFGEEERIFGYQGLDIHVRFAAQDCRPNVTISHDKKFNKVGEVRATDITRIMREFMPHSAFEDQYDKWVTNDKAACAFKPPGELVHSYEVPDNNKKGKTRKFEIWKGCLSDIGVSTQLDMIQIFVLFFIEGGQMLHLDDPAWTLDRWDVYFIYEVTEVPPNALNISPYVLAGYATTYRCWTLSLPETKPTTTTLTTLSDLEPINLTRQKCRLRISQVVILPPFQSNGHGSELYQTIYKSVMADETINELTVEDPSEEFDKLRDVNDWKVLEPIFRAADIKINTTGLSSQARYEKVPRKRLLDVKTLEKMRKQHKIAPRQFYRCMELFFLSQIPHSHRAAGGASLTKLLIKKHRSADPVDARYYWLRVIIKNRIWKQNSDKLVDVPKDEVVEKINDVTRGQEDEYEGYLLRLAAKEAAEQDRALENGEKEKKRNNNGTSSVVDVVEAGVVGDDGGNGGIDASTSETGPSVTVVSRKRKIIDDDDEDDEDEEDKNDEDDGGNMSDASKKARIAE